MSLIFFSLSISLFDSLSTTQQIIVFILLLTTVRPVRNALSYLAGLSASYFVCGIVGYQAFVQMSAILARFIPSTAKFSNPQYYLSEFFGGVLMVVIGIWYFRKKRHAPPSRSQNIVLAKLQSMNGLAAFGIGVVISVTSFPFSIPYLVALGKYTTLHIGLVAAIGHIVLYNIGYALPMVVIFWIYLVVRKGTLDMKDVLHEKARVLNVQLTTWALAGVGIFSMLDAGLFFVTGHALVKGRYF